MTKLNDLVGDRYGRLLVVRRTANRGKHVRWDCVCDCGGSTTASSTHLRSGHTTSCGCWRNELAAKRSVASAKHGMHLSPEYTAWRGMLARCFRPTNKKYKDYGARGITVCDEWRSDFAAFLAHVGRRTSSAHSLDRIRNAEGYKPGNVRWATDEEQNNNRRTNVAVEIGGERLTAAQIARRYGLTYRKVSYRIQAGWAAADIVSPSSRAGA